MRTVFVFNEVLIPILFPDYRIVNFPYQIKESGKYLLVSKYVRQAEIFTANPDVLIKLPFLSATCDIKLFDRNSVLDFVSKKFNLKINKTLQNHIVKVNEEEFFEFLKMTCVLRKWYKSSEEVFSKIYVLFEGLFESKKKFLNVYFGLCRRSSYPEVWSSVLTFLNRLDIFETQKDSLSEYYRVLLYNAKKSLSDYRVKLLPLFRIKKVSEAHLLNAMLELK